MIFPVEAVILCLAFTALVVPSAIKNPLAWVSDYPSAIQQRVRELGLIPAEQKGMPPAVVARKVIASLAMAVVLSLVLVKVNGAKTFLQGALTAYALWLIVDWYDALVLDCMWVCHSKKVIIPGTEDLVDAYHDYGFHIRMSMLGMLIGLPVCLLAGVGVKIINVLIS